MKTPSEFRHVTRRLTARNRLGLHARPAAEFVNCARLFRSAIDVVREDGERFRADRILELLTANLCEGDAFTLEADGPDAAAAVDRLAQLMEEFAKQEEPAAAPIAPRPRAPSDSSAEA